MQSVHTLHAFHTEFHNEAIIFHSKYNMKKAIAWADEPFNTDSDFRSILGKYTNVQRFVISTHGAPGGIGSTETPKRLFELTKKTLPKFAAEFATLMGHESLIMFRGCNVGYGPVGDAFLDALGKSALSGKGGKIRASIVYTKSEAIRRDPRTGEPYGEIELLTRESDTGISNSYTSSILEKHSIFSGRVKRYSYDRSGNRTKSDLEVQIFSKFTLE